MDNPPCLLSSSVCVCVSVFGWMYLYHSEDILYSPHNFKRQFED